MNASYNIVIKDIAELVSNLENEALYAATRMHLLNTNPATLDKMEATNSSIIFDMDEIMATKDERILRILHTYNKIEATMKHLEDYWKTTPDWANGEEL